MMRDFTVEAYIRLLDAFRQGGYSFQTFKQFLKQPAERVVILRHDVDKLPLNSLKFAQIERQMGMPATYYFRIVPQSFQPSVIRQILALGHEIGYHYEDMDLCKGDSARAYQSFQENLSRLRELAPIETACMHGSPLSRFDNRDLWKTYGYRELGISGEPYFDLDYSKVFYITDTGRKWNSTDSSIRDKVQSSFHIPVNSTFHLIQLVQAGKLPDQIMINTHPQRWSDYLLLWTKELVLQTGKNVAKRIVVKWCRGG